MNVQYGTPEDMTSWMDLVQEVSPNFPGLETPESIAEHRETVLRFMKNHRALCVKEQSKVVGVLLFSTSHNMICCLAVSPNHRRMGIASMLLAEALGNLDRSRDITVTTFRAEDKKGSAPRALYRKFGFTPGKLGVENDYPVQEFVLRAIERIIDEDEKEKIASEILTGLPEWFGLPESRASYIAESRKLPFWAAFAGDCPIGFLALKRTSPDTAEVFVMGILKEYHRIGIGRALYGTFEEYARKIGCSFAQVKTVQMGHYPEYDRTNRFYTAMGFRELECFPTLWDSWNPCQVYVKYLW